MTGDLHDLTRFVAAQRWYAAKGEPVKQASVADYVVWDVGGLSWLITILSLLVGVLLVMLLRRSFSEKEEDPPSG